MCKLCYVCTTFRNLGTTLNVQRLSCYGEVDTSCVEYVCSCDEPRRPLDSSRASRSKKLSSIVQEQHWAVFELIWEMSNASVIYDRDRRTQKARKKMKVRVKEGLLVSPYEVPPVCMWAQVIRTAISKWKHNIALPILGLTAVSQHRTRSKLVKKPQIFLCARPNHIHTDIIKLGASVISRWSILWDRSVNNTEALS